MTDLIERIEREKGPDRELKALASLYRQATPIRHEIRRRDGRDGEERFELIGHPCGFPVATFGTIEDAMFYAEAYHAMPFLIAAQPPASPGDEGGKSPTYDRASMIEGARMMREMAAKDAKTGWISADYDVVGIADADQAMKLCQHIEDSILALDPASVVGEG